MKKLIILCICFTISLCGCHRSTQDSANISEKVEQSVSQEGEVTKSDKAFIDKYTDISVKENAKRMALIYLDEDTTPELLLLKNGEYKIYSFNGTEVGEINMSNEEITANAYGPRHVFEKPEDMTFYWFEYVPYKGLIRVHGGKEGERYDYYLKYEDGLFITELEAKSMDYTWYTYDEEKEIDNEQFAVQLSELGYDKLIPCGYLYEDVMTAYENIGRISDTKQVLDDFVNGKIDAVCSVKKIEDIPEEGFVTQSFEEIYLDITSEEEWWREEEYIDFDNDGEEELILHGYAGARLFLDVIGDTVYVLLETSSTTDNGCVAEINGKRVIERTDLLHAGRKKYHIMQYDACCCLINRFRLYAEFEGDYYTADDKFKYNNEAISMEEFEAMVNMIQDLDD